MSVRIPTVPPLEVLTLRDKHPPAVWQQSLKRAVIAAMPLDRITNEPFDIVAGLRVLADRCACPDDIFEYCAGFDVWALIEYISRYLLHCR